MPTSSRNTSRRWTRRTSASSIRNPTLRPARRLALGPALGLALALLSRPAAAQQPATVHAAGRVVRVVGGDTLPVPGARVTLHRVGRAAQGPADSARTGADGRFDFRFPRDSAALFLLSARYADIEYFSPPVHTDPARPDTALVIAVADTSSRGIVDVAARHVVVSAPERDGTRRVLDLIELRNPGPMTRVAPDTLSASFVLPLPTGIRDFEVGQGDLSADAVVERGDSLLVLAPIAPGERQLMVQYVLPADATSLTLPLGAPVEAVNILAEEPRARVEGAGLALADSQVIEGRTFRRWTGATRAGAVVRVLVPGARSLSRRLLAALVGTLALALGAGTWFLLRRRPAPAGGALVDAIAELDARYAGREGEVPRPEWERYVERRARLKADLERALAGREGGA